ncbi:MAG: hypothetical protein JXA33_11400 [Anaerolineae bacterium]|nr:hypothetical protein [Anaerolineae bacterium]
MTTSTVAELFSLAIAAERTAETFYQGLVTKFAFYPTVAEFWSMYAKEEEVHARWLAQLRDKLPLEELSEPADMTIVEKLQNVLQFSVEDALQRIHNLEDAYQMVNDLENSETNAVFEFLIEHFATDERTQTFLRTQLRDHVGHLLIDFPTQFRTAMLRHEIKVIE